MMWRAKFLVVVGMLAVAGCGTKPTPAPPAAQPARSETSLRLMINAPVATVRETIVSRARQRGTAAKLANARSVVLERALADTPAALAAACGAHKSGRMVRILLTTEARGAGTEVSEQRFIVDTDGGNCAVELSPADAAEGMKSLADLKAQAESQVIRR